MVARKGFSADGLTILEAFLPRGCNVCCAIERSVIKEYTTRYFCRFFVFLFYYSDISGLNYSANKFH